MIKELIETYSSGNLPERQPSEVTKEVTKSALVEQLEEVKEEWELEFLKIIEQKQLTLSSFHTHVEELLLHIHKWKARTEQGIEEHFQKEKLAKHLNLLNALERSEKAVGSKDTSEHSISNTKGKLDTLGKAIMASKKSTSTERSFVVNSITDKTAYDLLDRLSGLTISTLKGSLKFRAIGSELSLAGRFNIKNGQCRLSDARLADGVLYAADVMNSAIHAINSWTGSIIYSTNQFSFQHTVLFPQLIELSKTGELHVRETISSKAITSVLNASLSNKNSIERKTTSGSKQKPFLTTLTKNPSCLRKKEDSGTDIEVVKSKEDMTADIISNIGMNSSKFSWTEENDNYILALIYHNNKVLFVNKHNLSYWCQTMDHFSGPTSGMLDCEGNVYICCSNINCIKKFSPTGEVKNTLSLHTLSIHRPIAIAYRDPNHFIVAEQMGRVSTVKIN